MESDPRHWMHGWIGPQTGWRVLGVAFGLLLALICWLVSTVNIFVAHFSG